MATSNDDCEKLYTARDLQIAADISEIKETLLFLKQAEERRTKECDDCHTEIDALKGELSAFKGAVKVVGIVGGCIWSIVLIIATWLMDTYLRYSSG